MWASILHWSEQGKAFASFWEGKGSVKQFFILSLEDDLKGKGESTKVSTKVNGSTNSLFSIKSIGEADIRTVYYNVASLQQKHCPMLSDMSVVAWLLLSDQSHLNISFWFTWLNMVVIKPGHRINNHGFACLWLRKRHYGNVGLFSFFCWWWCFFLTLKKNSPLTGVATPITIYCCDLCVTKLDLSVEEKEKQRSVSFFITLGNRCLCISFL